MATKLESPDGELLWSPNDFGTYSAEKVQLITNILSGLLSNLTLNMNTKVDENSLSNIYTISQTHEKFLEKENASETISMAVTSVLQTMYNDGRLVSPDAVDTVRTFVSNLYEVCYGYDLNGNLTPSAASSYNRQIDSLRDSITSNYSNILQLQRNVFGSFPDGSVNTGVLVLARANDVGNIANIDKGITDRDNIVEAINYLARNNSSVNALSSRVTVVERSVDGLDSDIDTITSRLDVNDGNISNMSRELTSVESDIKTLQTNIGDKNSLTTGEKSSIVSAINSLVISINDIKRRLDALENKGS